MLLRRSRNARFANLLWAAVKIVLVAFAAYIAYGSTVALNAATARAMAELSDPSAARRLGMGMETAPWFPLVMTLAISLPYPLFILIWFMRPKIKAECAEW